MTAEHATHDDSAAVFTAQFGHRRPTGLTATAVRFLCALVGFTAVATGCRDAKPTSVASGPTVIVDIARPGVTEWSVPREYSGPFSPRAMLVLQFEPGTIADRYYRSGLYALRVHVEAWTAEGLRSPRSLLVNEGHFADVSAPLDNPKQIRAGATYVMLGLIEIPSTRDIHVRVDVRTPDSNFASSAAILALQEWRF